MKFLSILMIPVFAFASGEPGTWFQFDIGDPAFNYFFSLVFSAGLPVFLVVALAHAIMGGE